MPVSNQLKKWCGKFGDDYTARNQATPENLEARKEWLEDVFGVLENMGHSPPKSVFEVGCGAGANLAALREIDPQIERHASEPNHSARQLARYHVSAFLDIDSAAASELWSYNDGEFDMVMTCGVLIHIGPEDLEKSLARIVALSKHYVLVAEYFAPADEPVLYHGEVDMLWRRDYGSLLLGRGLKHIAHGFLWKPVDGMDNLVWWLFEK